MVKGSRIKRGANWSFAETYSMIKLLYESGKNWDKVAATHQDLHKCNRTAKEIKTKYNNMKNDEYWQNEYQVEEFQAKHRDEPEDIYLVRKAEHEREQEDHKNKHGEIVTAIIKMEQREILAKSGSKRTASEMNNLIDAAEEERQQEQQKKKQKVEEMANVELETVTKALHVVENCEKHMAKANRLLEVATLAMLQLVPSIIPQATSILGTNNNSDGQTPTPAPASTRADAQQIAEEVIAQGSIHN